MNQELEDTVNSKIEEVLDKLLDSDEKFELKVQDAVTSLFESEDFTDHLGLIIVGNTNVYAQVKTIIRSMVETSAGHHPETGFSPILNGNSLPTL